jgi:hypothetical protein
MFVGTKPTGGWGSAGVTINGGYFDSGYYDSYAADVEELLADTKDLEETDDDIKKRGQAGDANKVRKALKDDLKYVESFAKQGYVGTVGGVNLYTKKDAVAGTIIIATKEAVTLFNKKGTEVEQERDSNIRKNSIFSRKYYFAALTDETKAVKITIA